MVQQVDHHRKPAVEPAQRYRAADPGHPQIESQRSQRSDNRRKIW
jgi:hypothetical protein